MFSRTANETGTSAGSVNSLGTSPAKRGSPSQIDTIVKRTDLQVARDASCFYNYRPPEICVNLVFKHKLQETRHVSITTACVIKNCFWDICVTFIFKPRCSR